MQFISQNSLALNNQSIKTKLLIRHMRFQYRSDTKLPKNCAPYHKTDTTLKNIGKR